MSKKGGVMRKYKLKFYKTAKGFRWRVKYNGKVVLASTECYDKKFNARRNWLSIPKILEKVEEEKE